jgi:hypothetical protein
MIDSLPGVRMTGENNDLLKRTMGVVKSTVDDPSWQSGGGYRGPWGHNPIPDQSLACPVQQMILSLNPPPVTQNGDPPVPANEDLFLGFKTIRFHLDLHSHEKQKIAVAKVKEFLPCARILINHRSDIHSQAESRKNAFGYEHDKTIDTIEHEMEQENMRLLNIAEWFGPERSFVLDSSKWTKNVTALNEAVHWLGFSKACWFPYLLEFNTETYANGGHTTLTMPIDCRYIGNDA